MTYFDTFAAGSDRPVRKTHHIPALKQFWYFALPSSAVARGKMQHLTLLGQSILLARQNDGRVFAMHNLCPHRSTPLHHGTFDGSEVQCRYHGWKFNGTGQCTLIPSLLAPQENLGDKIRNRTFPCREKQGGIWVFIGDRPEAELPPVPEMPGIGDVPPQAYTALTYPLNGEHSAYTFFDPSHVAFVHSSPFIKRCIGRFLISGRCAGWSVI